MIDIENSGDNELGLVWPQPGATPPSFDSPQAAAAFVAESCGLTFDDLNFIEPGDGEFLQTPSAWFPGIPHTALFYSDPKKGTYLLTQGAMGIVRKIRAGEFGTERLTTPYQPPTLSPGHSLGSFILHPEAGFDGLSGNRRTPLLRPEDAAEIDDQEEAVGVLEIIGEGKEQVVKLVLEDGTRLPFTDVAARELQVADPKIANLHGQTGVFRVGKIPYPNSGSIQMIKRDGSLAPVPAFIAVVEVYFEGESFIDHA